MLVRTADKFFSLMQRKVDGFFRPRKSQKWIFSIRGLDVWNATDICMLTCIQACVYHVHINAHFDLFEKMKTSKGHLQKGFFLF